MPFLPSSSPLYKVWEEFRTAIDIGDGALPPGSVQCALNVVRGMPLAAGYLYITKFWNQTAQLDVQNMMRFLQASFSSILNSATWLDPATNFQVIS